MANKKILCLDFDGVCHLYSSGWMGATVILNPPVDGLFDFLLEASAEFEINVFSSRSNQPGGIEAMKTWFIVQFEAWYRSKSFSSELILVDGVECSARSAISELLRFPAEKPQAHIGIDDRGWQFNGKWPKIKDLLAFKPWNRRKGGRPAGSLDDPESGQTVELTEQDREALLYLIKTFRDEWHQVLYTAPHYKDFYDRHKEMREEAATVSIQPMVILKPAQTTLEEHTKAVSEFLTELHAIMVDPLADGITPVPEMCKLLLETARQQREQLKELHEKKTAKVTFFQVAEELSTRNSPAIKLAPLDNVRNMRKVKAGTNVEIGVGFDCISGILDGRFTGGLLLCDTAEYLKVKAEMEGKQ